MTHLWASNSDIALIAKNIYFINKINFNKLFGLIKWLAIKCALPVPLTIKTINRTRFEIENSLRSWQSARGRESRLGSCMHVLNLSLATNNGLPRAPYCRALSYTPQADEFPARFCLTFMVADLIWTTDGLVCKIRDLFRVRCPYVRQCSFVWLSGLFNVV